MTAIAATPTVKRCATTVANMSTAEQRAFVALLGERVNAPQAKPVQAAKPQAKPVPAKRQRNAKRDAIMAQRKPSIGQMERINDEHYAADLRLYATYGEFKRVFPTMLDASLYFASLKA